MFYPPPPLHTDDKVIPAVNEEISKRSLRFPKKLFSRVDIKKGHLQVPDQNKTAFLDKHQGARNINKYSLSLTKEFTLKSIWRTTS